MREHKVFKISILVLSIIVVLALIIIGTVSATWEYRTHAILPKENAPKFIVGNWKYIEGDKDTGLSEIIIDGKDKTPPEPGPGETTPETPQNQRGGLNDPNSSLNQNIQSRKNAGYDTFSSMDRLNGSDVRSELGLNQDATFIVHFPPETPDTMYLYTTNVSTGYRPAFQSSVWNIPPGKRIYPVYRDTLVKNPDGSWRSAQTEIGSAESGTYASNMFGLWNSNVPAFVPSTWRAEVMGTSHNNAINCYKGQTIIANRKTANEVTNYIIQTGGSTTVSTSTPNTTFKIKDASGKLICKNTTSYTFEANASTQYFIEVKGAKDITLTIS